MYNVYYNKILGRFETLDDEDRADMKAKIVKDMETKKRLEREETKLCVLCGREFWEWGNDPWPLASKGWCCDRCNGIKVIPARLKQMH